MSARAPLTPTALIQRAVVASRGALIMIAVTAAAVAAIAVAGPAANTAELQSDLHYRTSIAGAPVRDLVSSTTDETYSNSGNPESTAGVVARIPAALVSIHASMPAGLRAITSAGRYVLRSEGLAGQGIQASGPPDQLPRSHYLYSIEANPRLRSDTVLVSGSWPAPLATFRSSVPIQLVTTVSSAKALHWKVGQVQQLAVFGSIHPRAVKLVGTVRPRDPDADYWQLDENRLRTSVIKSIDGDSVSYFADVWIDAGSCSKVSVEFSGPTIGTWFPTSSNSLGVNGVETLRTDISRFVATAHAVDAGSQNIQLRYTTELGPVLDSYIARASAASAVLSVVEVGPLGTGAALLLLAVLSLIDRRRSATDLLRARGASGVQYRLETAALVAVGTVLGALVGAVGAAVAMGGAPVGSTVASAVLVAFVPVAVAAAAAGARPPVLLRGGVAKPSRWRWVIDAVLILLAALALLLLLQRGLSDAPAGLGVDPLLAATPLLVSAGACAIVLRLVPIVLRRLAAPIRRSSGAIGLVGRANAARTGTRFLPAFAILTDISVSIFAGSVLATNQSGIHDAAVTQVGSDLSVSAPELPESLVKKIAALPGVANLAAIDSPGAVTLDGQSQNVAVFSVDPAQLRAVESVLPASRRQFAALGTTADGHAVAYAGGFTSKLADVTRFAGSKAAAIHTVTVTDPPPKFIDGSPWLLIDSSTTPKDLGLEHDIKTALIRVTPGTDQPALQRRIQSMVGASATVASAETQITSLTGAPIVGGLSGLTLLAVVLSLLLGVLALLLSLVTGSRDRAIVLARLRTLGFTPRQATGLVGWEVGPMTVLGIVVGAVVGSVLPVIFLAAVDLSEFIGSTEPPALVLDPLFIGIVVVAFAASTVIAVIVAARLSGRGATPAKRRNEGLT